MKINEDKAELYGALIGDGCLSRYNVKNRIKPREVILYTGHLVNDLDYYNNVVVPLFVQEFKTVGYLQERKSYNCIIYTVFNREVFNFFEKMGFPVGKKSKLRIPDEILNNKKKAISCVRGIFDTDGSVYKRYSQKYKNHSRLYNYLVIQIRLNSFEVINQIKQILTKIDINTNKIGRYKKSYVLRVTDQKHIKRFMEIIKPSNKYHLVRYLNKSNSS